MSIKSFCVLGLQGMCLHLCPMEYMVILTFLLIVTETLLLFPMV